MPLLFGKYLFRLLYGNLLGKSTNYYFYVYSLVGKILNYLFIDGINLYDCVCVWVEYGIGHQYKL